VEYSQRASLMEIEKLKFKTVMEGKEGEMYLFGNKIFILPDIKQPDMKLIDLEKNMITKAEASEFEEALKKPLKGKLTFGILKRIEELLGKKIEILL